MRTLVTWLLVMGFAAGCGPGVNPEEARRDIAAVLDDFHAAAAAADEERYLGHLAADGVFLGTDGGERWTAEGFREFVHPYFSRGQGWTYRPRDRHIAVSEPAEVAWFDELLDHDRYGELRGTGVLRRRAGRWEIVQYNLTFTVPNDVAADVVARIRAGSAAGGETPAPDEAGETDSAVRRRDRPGSAPTPPRGSPR